MSPIFPVVPDKAPREPLSGAKHVAFLCPLRPFEYIGKQPKDIQDTLWFSLGIAAVIVFADNFASIEALTKAQEDFSAYEIWDVENGKTSAGPIWVRPVEVEPCELDGFAGLSKDIVRLLEEIQANLHEAARVAAIYMPEQVLKLRRVVEAANEIIADLKYLEFPDSAPAPSHFKQGNAVTDAKSASNHQRVNQRITHLIQLNSALAYMVSQTAHGTVPILEGPSLVANHALLGVGTAHRAISALAGFVEDVFEQQPILSAMDTSYRNMPGVEVFPDVWRYDRQTWLKAGIGIDAFLAKLPKEPTRPKLSYFSARLGFAETHFSITTANQVLHGADAVRWSLMTLTHELLHSHVTGILATIFGESLTDGLSWETFVKFHTGFKAFMETPSDSREPKMLESLRYMIFSFAAARHDALAKVEEVDRAAADSTTSGLKVASRLPSDADLFRSFYRSSLRLLEELIVHTLDLHYFYSGDTETFLGVLWESWTTVPAVVGDLETYLLRSITAIATMENGSVAQRFTLARQRLLTKLNELGVADEKNTFLKKAHAHLYDDRNTKRLRVLFYPALYIADATAIFMRCGALEARFWSEDENIEPSGQGRYNYSVETGSFSGTRVKNPIAFLADHTRRSPVEPALGEDHRSAWLLLATASAAPFV